MNSRPNAVTAVFDTNILVRLALKKTNAVDRLWEAFQEGRFDLVLSPLILEELDRVLHYPRIAKRHDLDEERIRFFLDELRKPAILSQDLYEVSRVEADETDNIFLACALEAYADYVVTEDQHLRNIKYFHGVQIVGLEQFQKEIGL